MTVMAAVVSDTVANAFNIGIAFGLFLVMPVIITIGYMKNKDLDKKPPRENPPADTSSESKEE